MIGRNYAAHIEPEPATVKVTTRARPRPLTIMQVAFAVLLGNIMTAVLGLALYYAFK
jgi:hypothetical protein